MTDNKVRVTFPCSTPSSTEYVMLGENSSTATSFQDIDVHAPAHYNSHPSKVECITITEHMNFCLGNAVKYIWRAGLKTKDPTKDLKKAIFYLQRELDRISK